MRIFILCTKYPLQKFKYNCTNTNVYFCGMGSTSVLHTVEANIIFNKIND